MNRERFALTAIVLLGMVFLWMAAIVFASGCASGNLSPEITAEADIRADLKADLELEIRTEVEAELCIELQAELDLALSKQSLNATGGDGSTVIQVAGGGGGLLAGLLLGAWLGRRTPLKALGRTVQAIEQQDATKNVRHVVASLGRRPGRSPYVDRAGRMIHRIVKAGRS